MFHHRSQHWVLSPHKAIYWQEEQALIVSDLHLGKSAHFRKAGIAVPANIVQEDLFCLQKLITLYQPLRIIIVGDLFHSVANNDIAYFRLWRQQFAHLAFELVQGNHDILRPALYAELQVQVHTHLQLRNIYFAHDAEEALPQKKYVISGHIHPGVVISGMGKQSMRLPCFYFGKKYAVLPAFGKFTGLASVAPEPQESVFVIADQQVLQWQ
ncbi:ligase-associated DNA damage response endonuclease PdeM [Chitinophaga costaii]|nr:ligase-associated DNA damage response endonuclease PdeM [Chitinophaga costaii]